MKWNEMKIIFQQVYIQTFSVDCMLIAHIGKESVQLYACFQQR